MFRYTVIPFKPEACKATAVVFAREKGRLLPEAAAVDTACGGAVSQALKSSRFTGAAGELFAVTGLSGPVDCVLVAGLGKVDDVQENDWRLRGIEAGKRLDELGVGEATLVTGARTGKVDVLTAAGAFLEGLHLALYRFDRFRTEMKPHQRARFRKVSVALDRDRVAGVRRRLDGFKGLMEGSDLARELVNLPPNIAVPPYMARRARELAELGIRVEVLDEKRLKRLGLNLMLAVGSGAAPGQQPRLILLRYAGAGRGKPFRAVAGKGVMFDAGGYNLKPSGSIESMKCDMAGAAAVLGLMKALALRKSQVNVLGVCGCVVNMISDRAYLPSTVLESYKGLTVEIGNTDAEGRLVLADAIAYVLDREKPAQLIDLATLTGACMVALGGQYAGLFSNNDRLAAQWREAGERTGERLWRLPIDDAYAAKPLLADVNNDGKRYGGASTGAVFLKRFVGDTPWAHLDIAGMVLQEKGLETAVPVSGATGFGVRLLVDYLERAGSDTR